MTNLDLLLLRVPFVGNLVHLDLVFVLQLRQKGERFWVLVLVKVRAHFVNSSGHISVVGVQRNYLQVVSDLLGAAITHFFVALVTHHFWLAWIPLSDRLHAHEWVLLQIHLHELVLHHILVELLILRILPAALSIEHHHHVLIHVWIHEPLRELRVTLHH